MSDLETRDGEANTAMSNPIHSADLARLFDLSLDLLCVAGTDGFFKSVNPAFERILGHSPGELLSRSFVEFVHPDDRESTLREVGHLAEGKVIVDFRNRYLAKDGSWRWIAWRATPVAERGLIYAVGRDITEQIIIDEDLAAQGRELARSNADLADFAAIASHDLRAPLRGMSNLARWIEEDSGESLTEKVRAHLAMLRRRITKMERLIDDLLAYARAGSGTNRTTTEKADPLGTSNCEVVDTKLLVAEVVELLAPPAGMEIVVEDNLPALETPRAPLEHVFRNLIDNAVVHHDRDTGRIVVAARETGEIWEFEVADDGPGITDGERERIFERFHTSGGKRRTGLGLALVARFVSQVGGTVEVSSESGRGACFRFTWPTTTR